MYSYRRYTKKRNEMNPFALFVVFVAIAASLLAWVAYCSISQDKSFDDYMKSTPSTVCVETTNFNLICR